MDQLPPEIIEAILNNFPVSRKGLSDLNSMLTAMNYTADENFWCLLYRNKIDSVALTPPLDTWKESYRAYIFNHKTHIPLEEISCTFVDSLVEDTIDYDVILRTDLAGRAICGKSFNLRRDDSILDIGHEGNKITITYNPYLLRLNRWKDYYIERNLLIPDVPGAEIRKEDIEISFWTKLTLQIVD